MLARLLAIAILAATSSAQEAKPTPPRFDTFGWTRLFDGHSLTGWQQFGGRYDGKADWRVADGAIVGRENDAGEGGLLYTQQRYASFCLSLQVRLDAPFDSGVFFRMVAPPGGKGAQWTLDDRPGGEIGAVYSDGFLMHNTEAVQHWRRGEWNLVELRVTGRDMHIEGWLNGRKVTDHRIAPGTPGFAPNGRIGLQVHGGGAGGRKEARFREVLLRELPYFDDARFTCDEHGFLTPTEAGRKDGWRSLLNGQDLGGWEVQGDPRGYVVRGGMLLLPRGHGDGHLFSTEDYEDFELCADFRLERAANSGIFLRGRRGGGDPAYSGCEIQILDDFNFEDVHGAKLKPWQFCGSLYAAAPPAIKDALNPPGMWNTYRIRFVGSRLRVELNGHELYDLDTHALKQARPPFQERAQRGFIGIQRHTPSQTEGEFFAAFRNLFVRPVERR